MNNYRSDRNFGISGNHGGFHPAFLTAWEKQYFESTWGDESQPRGWGSLSTKMKPKVGQSRLTNKNLRFRQRESPEVFFVEKHRLALVIKLRPAMNDKGLMYVSSEIPDGRGGYAGIFVIHEIQRKWFAKFVVNDGEYTDATAMYPGNSPQAALAALCGAKRWFKCGDSWHSLYDLYPQVKFYGFTGNEARPKQNTTRLETTSHGFWFYEAWRDITPIKPAPAPVAQFGNFKPTMNPDYEPVPFKPREIKFDIQVAPAVVQNRSTVNDGTPAARLAKANEMIAFCKQYLYLDAKNGNSKFQESLTYWTKVKTELEK